MKALALLLAMGGKTRLPPAMCNNGPYRANEREKSVLHARGNFYRGSGREDFYRQCDGNVPSKLF